MIIRKPYAFLIKYFKVIHITLFVFMTYLLFKTRNIYIFFKDFLKTGTYTYIENIVSNYINIPMIIISIILIGILFLIYFLMKQKKKPVFYYLMAIIFYTVTFASLIFFMSVYSNLEYQSYSNQSLVIFRDLSMVLYYLNYFFIVISFVRGFGFNIKKFNFEKDIKELDITEADREEIEVSANVDYENVFNFFRKRKRYLKYYFKENSFILIVFLVIILLGLTAYLSIDKFIINKNYSEGELISINNLEYIINNSYLTNKDKYGNFLKDKETYYLVVDFNVLNKNLENKKIEKDLSRVKIGKNYYYSKSNYVSKFNDLGVVYKNQLLMKGVNNNYIFVFEIGNLPNEKIVFELYSNKNVVNGEAVIKYKNIILDTITFKETNLCSFKLMEKINLENTYLENISFNLNDYEILDKYTYTYTKCDKDINDGECLDYEASIVPSIRKKLLKIDYAISDNDINIFDYLNVLYETNGNVYVMDYNSMKNVTPESIENIFLLEISDDIKFDTISFNFNVRGIMFSVKK